VCVSKTLLCALVAKCGLAVRQNLKVEKSGALAAVVDQVSALIQAQETGGIHSKAIDNIRMLAAVTPDANENLHTALRNVIDDIVRTVESKISTSFAATQAAVDKSIADIDTDTTEAQRVKAIADTSDSTYYTCITEEKSMRAAYEGFVTDLATATSDKVKPCQNQEDSKDFESDPNVGDGKWEFSCDFGTDTNWRNACDDSFGNYKTRVTNMLDQLKVDAAAATTTWTTAQASCVLATNNMEKAEDDKTNAESKWQGQNTLCLTRLGDRNRDLCAFGSSYQAKCLQVGEYNVLIAEVAGEGSDHSDPDRAAEWETTQVTKCLLEEVIKGTDLDELSAQNCRDKSTYASLGTVDTKNAQFVGLTSSTSFTCSEPEITFHGMDWVVPQSASPASADYTTFKYSPPVDHHPSTATFDFCSVGGKN